MSEESKPYPVPPDEDRRLAAVSRYDVADCPQQADLDRLARLAARLFDAPIALISLIGEDRQVFRARVGLEVGEASREVSFGAHAIMADDVLVIPDALADPRFSANPLVVGPPYARFYAGAPLRAAGGERIGTVCIIDDKPRPDLSETERSNLADVAALVTERLEMHRLDSVRSVSQARFENIAATSPDAIVCASSEGRITFWNHAAEVLFGYTDEEMLDRSVEVLVPESWRGIYGAEVARLQDGTRLELADRTISLSGLRKDGSEFPAELSLSTWQEGGHVGIGVIVRDITERRQNEERLFRLASVDPLTDLPNRGAWNERLAAAVESDRPATVLLLDLDGFKDVNDTLGHSAGDAVLTAVAQRLRHTCPEALMLARLGGDEFVALLPGGSETRARAVAQSVTAALARPYLVPGDESLHLGVSIGISLYPRHGGTAEELLGAADLALYRAKAAGKGGHEVFRPALREAAAARRTFEAELKRAFENGEFELYYQPQFSTAGGTLVGAEALLRWNHPQRGLLTPASFVDVLGEKPSAPAIGEWILATACRQAAEWRRVVPSFRMGVNLFAVQLRPGVLLPTLPRMLLRHGLPPQALELEILENVLLGSDTQILDLLRELRLLGVGLAFDDYGTGFASLSLLKRYPVSRLKIDRSFVHDVDSDMENAGVVRALLYLARTFGMDVTAEGVETEAELAFLRRNGCPSFQGYLRGRPVDVAEFTRRFVEPATERSVALLD